MPFITNPDQKFNIDEKKRETSETGIPITTVAKEAIQNIPRDAMRVGGELVKAFSPFKTEEGKRPIVETGKGVVELGKSVVEFAIPGGEKGELARTMGQYFVDRYGSVEAFKESLAKTPVETVMDFSSFFTGIGGAMKFASGASKMANLQSVAKVLETASKGVGKVGKATDVTSLPFRGAKGLATAVSERAVKSIGLFQNSIGRQAIDFLSEEYVKRGLNVTRRTVNKLEASIKKAQAEINKALAKSGPQTVIGTKEITGVLDKLILEFKESGFSPADIRQIKKLGKDMEEMNGMFLGVEDLQKIKVGLNRAFDPDISDKFAKAKAKGRERLRIAAKERLEKIAPEIKDLNANEGVMIELKEAINKKIVQHERRPLVPIKGFVFGLLGGAIAKGIGADLLTAGQVAATAIVAEKIVDSPRMASLLARASRRARQLALAGEKATEATGRQVFISERARQQQEIQLER